jgi:hypothetical protein
MRKLTLFLSTGRCGTQWLARHLSELYPDEADVTHEPLGALYKPSLYFRSYDEPRRPLELDAVRAHVERIAATLETRSYIETGWPSFAAVPMFIELFGDRTRLVHLVRHPVPTSVSHSVHQLFYGSPRVDDYTRHATLHPALPGAFQRELNGHWTRMSAFERCLFWWTELNLYALELRERFPQVPQLTIRSEEMLSGDPEAIAMLLAHLGLSDTGELAGRTAGVEDRWHHRTDRDLDWSAIRRYPRALALAERFGYDVDAIDDTAIAGRYRGRPSAG